MAYASGSRSDVGVISWAEKRQNRKVFFTKANYSHQGKMR